MASRKREGSSLINAFVWLLSRLRTYPILIKVPHSIVNAPQLSRCCQNLGIELVPRVHIVSTADTKNCGWFIGGASPQIYVNLHNIYRDCKRFGVPTLPKYNHTLRFVLLHELGHAYYAQHAPQRYRWEDWFRYGHWRKVFIPTALSLIILSAPSSVGMHMMVSAILGYIGWCGAPVVSNWIYMRFWYEHSRSERDANVFVQILFDWSGCADLVSYTGPLPPPRCLSVYEQMIAELTLKFDSIINLIAHQQ